MLFEEAFKAMIRGKKIMCPEWNGYWFFDGNTIKLFANNGDIKDIIETCNTITILSLAARNDWEIIFDTAAAPDLFDFGEALKRLKAGQRVCRKGWNGKGMSVAYFKGYPNGVSCNEQTIKAWKLNKGDTFVCNPYFQIKQPDGSYSMWAPSIGDVLAEDWVCAD